MKFIKFLMTIILVICVEVSFSSEFEINVMNYNILGLPLPFQKTKKRFKNMVKKFNEIKGSKLEPDIIAFQEAFTKRTRILAKGLKYPYTYKGPKGKGVKIGSGLMIYSKYPIKKVNTHIFKNCAKLDCMTRKGIVHAVIEHPSGVKIDLYNTHLQASKSGGFFTSRRTTSLVKILQVEEIEKFVKKTHNKDHLLFLLGDFNFTESSDHFFRLLNFIGVDETLLRCIDNQCDGDSDLVKMRKNLIDHQFFKDNDRLTIRPIYFDQLWKSYSKKQLSDHFPVLARYLVYER